MTDVTATYRKDRYTLAIHGHAEGSPKSCNAVSAIIYALAGWLDNRPELRDELRLGKGDVLIAFHGGKDARAAMDMAVIGLGQIAEQGGREFVKVSVAVIRRTDFNTATRGRRRKNTRARHTGPFNARDTGARSR